MIGHRCGNCQWWDNEHPSVAEAEPQLGKRVLGFCRKHKPGGLKIGHHFYGVWPLTDEADFCGEFREG